MPHWFLPRRISGQFETLEEGSIVVPVDQAGGVLAARVDNGDWPLCGHPRFYPMVSSQTSDSTPDERAIITQRRYN